MEVKLEAVVIPSAFSAAWCLMIKLQLWASNCSNWVCLKCASIPETLYQELVKCGNTANDIKW